MSKSKKDNNEFNFFDDLINEVAASIVNTSHMSIVDFAHQVIFNNDPVFQLFPTQKAILKSLYNEPLVEEEKEILRSWREQDRTTWVDGRKYINLVLEAGRRGSKCNAASAFINTTIGRITFHEFYNVCKNIRTGSKSNNTDILQPGILTYNPKTWKPELTHNYFIQFNGTHTVYEVSTTTNKKEITTGEHPYLVWKEGKDEPEWVLASELKVGDYILTATNTSIFGQLNLIRTQCHQLTTELLRAETAVQKHLALSQFRALDKDSLYTILCNICRSNGTKHNNEVAYSIRINKIPYIKDDLISAFLKFGISTASSSHEKEDRVNFTRHGFTRLCEVFGDAFLANTSNYRKLRSTVRHGYDYEVYACPALISIINKLDITARLPKTATLQQCKEKLPAKAKGLLKYINPNVQWEPISSIEILGEQPTYALEVYGTNIIGNDIITHNSTLGSIIALKEFHDLLTLESPARTYKLLPSSPIAILVVGQSQDQVKETIFSQIKGFAESSLYFQTLKKAKVIEILGTEIRCPNKNIAIYAKHTNTSGLVGYNVKALILDEVARFETNSEGVNTAFEVMDNVGKGGAAFDEHYKSVAISSAWEHGDPIEKMFENAKADYQSIAFKLTTFQLNLSLKKGVSRKVVSDYAVDYIKSRLEYEGIRYSKLNNLILKDNLERNKLGSSVIDARPTDIDITMPNGQIKRYAGLQVDRIEIAPDFIKSFIHVDPALKKDSAGLAVVSPRIFTDNKWKISVDGLLKWEPSVDKVGNRRLVSFIDIEEKIEDLIPARNVQRVTFDQWNCLQEDSRILQKLNNNWVLSKVKNLKLGDTVLSSKNTENKIVALESKSNIPTVKITTKNGYELIGTYNHPIMNKQGHFVELQNLKINDEVKLNIGDLHSVDNIVITKKDAEALVLGYLIAEGDWTYYGTSYNIRFSNREEEVKEDYKVAFEQVINQPVKILDTGIRKESKYYYKRLTEELGLVTGAINKKIPDYIFHSSKKEIGLLLSGLFEGDGNITCFIPGEKYQKKSKLIYVELNTKSELLSKQVQQLLLYLGIKCNRKRIDKKTPKGAPTFCYRILIYGQNIIKFKDCIGFRSSRKSTLLDSAISNLSFKRKSRVNYPEDKIISIEHCVSNIMHMEVSGDHTYQSEFVNHNSASFIQRLIMQGIDSEEVSSSREAQFTYYTLFRDLLAHDFIILPVDSLWSNQAITELSELVMKPNKQIIHPFASKDLADAIVNAVYQCYTHMVGMGMTAGIGLKVSTTPSKNLTQLKIGKGASAKIKVGAAVQRLHNRRN